jgi:hypothetical protein
MSLINEYHSLYEDIYFNPSIDESEKAESLLMLDCIIEELEQNLYEACNVGV